MSERAYFLLSCIIIAPGAWFADQWLGRMLPFPVDVLASFACMILAWVIFTGVVTMAVRRRGKHT